MTREVLEHLPNLSHKSGCKHAAGTYYAITAAVLWRRLCPIRVRTEKFNLDGYPLEPFQLHNFFIALGTGFLYYLQFACSAKSSFDSTFRIGYILRFLQSAVG